MPTSFFKKFTPAGSTPIAAQQLVVKTNASVDDGRIKSKPSLAAAMTNGRDRKRSENAKQPRRSISTSTLAVATAASRIPTPPTTNSSAANRRNLDSPRSTPNLKRALGRKRDTLKPPSPESLGSLARSSRSPTSLRLQSSDEEESEDERGSKRPKVGTGSPGATVDKARKIVHPLSFHIKDPKTGEPLKRCIYIHADEIANVKLPSWSRRKGKATQPPAHLEGNRTDGPQSFDTATTSY
jgi:hypothetical protein